MENHIETIVDAIIDDGEVIGRVVAGHIVRCKNCANKTVEGETTHYYYCNELKRSVDEEDYCCWGKRDSE